jgi:hypothetical protein
MVDSKNKAAKPRSPLTWPSAFCLCLFCLGGLLAKPASAQLIALEPDQGGPDFIVQGEYSGATVSASGSSSGLGAQIVAQGDGDFRVVFFPGGLPGDGWNGRDRFESVGKIQSAKTEITGDDYQGSLQGDTLSGSSADGGHFRLAKRMRISPTVGLAPPAQATVLFDGSSLDEWDNASIDGRGFFAPLDPVATTKKRFTDFSMHMEFRLPFMPFARGQARGNSGLKFLIAGAFFAEIQILDSFGNIPQTDECGGIEVLFQPELVASFPPLTWQTYDIHLTTPVFPDTATIKVGKGVMTVWHNGILIHAGRELPAMAAAVNVALQKYVDPLVFRNMWILEGNDHYPFFPGAAIRTGKPEGATVGSGNSKGTGIMQSIGNGRARSILLRGPGGLYLSDGTRAYGLPPR